MAPVLLNATVVSELDGQLVRARITEVEAYEGAHDPASHAFRGRTKRNSVMFGEAGHLYCYFVYGMHWCANVVCGPPDIAAAVLLRAAEIVVGEPDGQRQGITATSPAKLASGPARLARCLGLNGSHTGLDLLDPASPVRLERLAPASDYRSGPRVGITVGTEHPWRFWLPDDPTVSAFRPGGRKRARQTGQT